ncbi:Hypothetical protein NCS54_00620000 [Fusarium falciforme]|uniref:Hypothetical protein n=1 Tax=Fusarium falciforme TaxID=195108 RepID=UPI00230182F9|nr:Hypothetical protein NCS54_00620000 [Fusarium falciforme]WAO88838.1 Hypothetical protein NCS54_00620000 [Fusarium falciforme]
MAQPASDTEQQYGDAPEVVPGSGPEVAYDRAGMYLIQPDRENYPELHPSSAKSKSGAHIAEQKILSRGPWWKRRRAWIILAGSLLAVIGLVVGLVVGLKNASHNTPETTDDVDVDPASLCNGAVCPQVIATAAFRDELHIFISSSNGNIQHRSGNGSSFDYSSWEDLFKTGTLTQPVAMAWKPDGKDRLDVFALSSQDRTIYGLHLQDGNWSGWEEIASGADSQPILCKIADNRIDMWTTDLESHNITQNDWIIEKNSFWSTSDGNGKFRTSDTGPARSAPGIVCRDYNITQDIAWYDRDSGSLWYRFYTDDDGWFKSRDIGGHFIGDPALVSFVNYPQRLDFFGVGEDHQVHHFSRTGDEDSKLEALGGNVTSTLAVVSPSKGVMDAVALGRDGRIKHIHYNGSAWADEWEDLGVSASAAPQVVIFNGWVVLIALGKHEVRYASWKSGAEAQTERHAQGQAAISGEAPVGEMLGVPDPEADLEDELAEDSLEGEAGEDEIFFLESDDA